MAIEIVNRQRLVRIDRRQIAAIARDALAAARNSIDAGTPLPADPETTVAFVRDAAIRKLNLIYRGKDRATDVLSFPARGDQPLSTGDHFVDESYLGDIVISVDAAARQAAEAGHSVEREVNELVLHGILHLCGYDHETDRGEMNRLELKLRRKLLDSK